MLPWIFEHMLTIAIASPLIGIALLALIPRRHEDAAPEIALAGSAPSLFLSAVMLGAYKGGERFSFIDVHEWVPSMGISYSVGVDGAGLLFFAATALLFVLSIVSVWRKAKNFRKEYFAALLASEIGFLAFFAARDAMLMLAAIGFATAFAGLSPAGDDRPKYYGFMSVAWTALLVIAVLLVQAAGTADMAAIEKVHIVSGAQHILLPLLVISSSVFMGVFPFSRWMRDAMAGGGFTPVPVVIAAAGACILFRLLPPFAYILIGFGTLLLWIAAAVILCSSLVAIAQSGSVGAGGGMRGIQLLLPQVISTYSGYLLLGILSANAQAISGGIFLAVGLMLLAPAFVILSMAGRKPGPAPVAAFGSAIALLALGGLPLLTLFPGLFMVWMGLFNESAALAAASILGMVFISAAIVRTIGRISAGSGLTGGMRRTTAAEMFAVMPAVLLIILIGVFPDAILRYIRPSAEAVWNLLFI